MVQIPQHFPLAGGLDLITPAIRTPPGRAIAAKNYEPVERGYSRLQGMERLDGRPKPSAQSYWTLDFDAGSTQVMEGDTVEGANSGATGVSLYDVTAETGSYGGGDATGTLVLSQVSGAFQDGEDLEVSSSKVAEADGTATERGADNDADDTTYIRAAIEYARTQIAKVSGSGPVRGVWVYNGVKYAFRDNSGGTAGVMHKSSSSGWTTVDLGLEIDFTSGGTTAIAEADTITGATSGATATVERVILQSGSWSGGDAAGYLILSGQTGTFQSENLDVGASPNLATIAGDSSAITLPAGGRYELRNENFFGASDLYRMYGVNGVGKAFEFDGSVFVPIRTGMTVDTPNHLEIFRNHLFLSFPGGSLQNSSTGDPYEWSVITGALEIGLGTDVTGMLDYIESAMVVFGRGRVSILYGTSASDFDLVRMSDEETGAIEWTVQRIGRAMYMDDNGVRSIDTTQNYGNFTLGTVTPPDPPAAGRQAQGGGHGQSLAPRSHEGAVPPVLQRRHRRHRLFRATGAGSPAVRPGRHGRVRVRRVERRRHRDPADRR